MDRCSAASFSSDWRSASRAVSFGFFGTASGILALTPPPDSSPSQRARMSLAEVSAIRLAMSQPITGATMAPRRYSPNRPLTGSATSATTARAPMMTSTSVPSALNAASVDLASTSRNRKAMTHSSSPGRKSTPQTRVTSVSRVSRSLRSREADRQCSTTVCGSIPNDWIRAPRAPPRVRSVTAREKASPRFGLK